MKCSVYVFFVSCILVVSLSNAKHGSGMLEKGISPLQGVIFPRDMISYQLQTHEIAKRSSGIFELAKPRGFFGEIVHVIITIITWPFKMVEYIILGPPIPKECQQFLPAVSIVNKVAALVNAALYFVMPIVWLLNPLNIIGTIFLGPFYNAVLAVLTPMRGMAKFLISIGGIPLLTFIRKFGFVYRSFWLLNLTDFGIEAMKIIVNFFL